MISPASHHARRRYPACARGRLSMLAWLPLSSLAACIGTVDNKGTSMTPAEGPDPSGNVTLPGGGGNQTPAPGSLAVTSRAMRLSNAQWKNTVQDLFRLPAVVGLSSEFVADPHIGAFDTYGGTLMVDSNRWKDYQTAAETVAKQVAHDAASLAKIAPPAADTTTRKKTFIRDFGLRAFRRPLTDADVSRYTALFDQGATLIGSGDAFVDGAELTLRAFLQSPNFLYRLETSTKVVNGRVPLNNYEIATRLSYSLTGSMPDDTLFAAAAAGKLQSRHGVTAEAQRLVTSPAGQAAVSNFHYQLLNLDTYDQISKDVQNAPAFTMDIAASLKQEPLVFVNNVIFGQDRGVAELLSAPYTFGNSKIAKIYGISVPAAAGRADPFVKIDLDPAQRAGLLTQVGVLSANAVGQTPSLIPRAVQIAENILCVTLPAPPDNVPPLPDLLPNLTNRQRVEMLTANQPCTSCHSTLINPLGFAFETLDGFAQYRVTENGHPIDAAGKYTIDGKEVSFNGAVELMKAISQSQQAHDCYARHMAEFVYGRDIDMHNAADKALVAEAGARAKSMPSIKSLIVSLVTSDVFLMRAP